MQNMYLHMWERVGRWVCLEVEGGLGAEANIKTELRQEKEEGCSEHNQDRAEKAPNTGKSGEKDSPTLKKS